MSEYKTRNNPKNPKKPPVIEFEKTDLPIKELCLLLVKHRVYRRPESAELLVRDDLKKGRLTREWILSLMAAVEKNTPVTISLNDSGVYAWSELPS